MSDFWEDNEDYPKSWVSYYGEYRHKTNDCEILQDSKTRRRTRSSRPKCPNCYE